MIKYIASIFVLASTVFTSYGQYCNVTMTPVDTLICEGDSVLVTTMAALNNLAPGQTFNFNSGALPSGWNSTGGTQFGQPCVPGIDGTPYFWASTSGSSEPQVSTQAFDISCGGVILFDMVYSVQGGSSPCEGPDEQDEGVSLQYSTDGGITWIDIVYYSPGGFELPSNPMTSGSIATGATQYTSWNSFSVPIPGAAVTTSTMFRWYQAESSGTCCDNWGLDNIVINASAGPCTTSGYVNWSNGMSGTTGNTSFYMTPQGDTTLVAYVYDSLGVLQCMSDTTYINISVRPEPYAGPDQSVCLGDPIVMAGVPADAANNNVLWIPNTSLVSPTPTVNISPNFSTPDATVTVNQPGTYLMILRESNPICGNNVDTAVIVVSELDISASGVAPSCQGLSDGEIHIDSPDAIEYSFDGGNTWVADSFDVVFNAGAYNVCGRNAAGCEACVAVNVIDPIAVTISVSNDTLVCQNGTAYMVATGGGAGSTYTYHWDHTVSTNSAQQVDPASATSYTVYAENELGCVSPTETINVSVRPGLTGDITPWDTICPGYPTDIMANVTGGIGQPYVFNWSSGDSQTGPSSHTINVNPAVTTDYTVTITDGCESTPLVLETNVRVAPLPVPDYYVTNPEQCEPAVFEVINTTDPTLSQYVYWLVDNDEQFINQDTIYTQEFMAGDYDLQMIVTTYEGCVDSLTFEDAFTVMPRPEAKFSHSPNPVQMFNTNVYFNNTSFLGYTYEWYFESGSPATSTQENPHTQFPDGETGSYEVVLITTSELGCKDTMEYQLIVLPEVLIYAPNAFTPDGDEHNQGWRVFMEGVDPYDFELLVFNRWGEVIWESHDIEVAWDGTYNGKPVETGTYAWTIRTKDILNDSKYTYSGHVTILR